MAGPIVVLDTRDQLFLIKVCCSGVSSGAFGKAGDALRDLLSGLGAK